VENGQLHKKHESFFISHGENAMWQSENARLVSLTAAAIYGGKISHKGPQGAFGVNREPASRQRRWEYE
jgi:hypothetical protein